MSGSHDHAAPAGQGRAFGLGVALNVAFVLLEAIVGVAAGSVALLADAGHNLSDVLGLLLAWGASALSRRLPTERHTYGLRRSTVLAALLNALLLLVAIGAIAWEAVRRFRQPEAPEGWLVIWTALAGVVINTTTALLFRRGRQRDLNVRGAFLHMAADAAVSLGVAVAGAVILFTGWAWIDPAVSLAIVAVVFVGTWSLLRDSVYLALDAVPRGTDLDGIRDYLSGLPGILDVHDLHVWALSTTETALTAHLVRKDTGDDGLVRRIGDELHQRFGVEHVTLQVESPSAPACPLVSQESG